MTAGTTRDPVTVGPYRLVRKLGEGGMGVVHLATDPAGRAVALKVLRAHVANDEEARRRLGREVATLRRVRHPRVAEVLDADVVGAEPYLVTRFVPGRSLEEEVKATGPLPAGQVAQIGRALAEALSAIHAAGVVHRDVKPANVMLVDGEPVLIDFGIAHIADESRITRTGLVMGTPGYLSPELIYGGPVTPATDWWAWGATLVFASTGRQPFGTGPIESILERVRRGQAEVGGIETGLRELLAATLTVDASRRPTAAQLVARLDDVIAGVTTAPSSVEADAGGQDPTRRTAPPDRTKRMPPPAEPRGGAASIPPYPGARRPRNDPQPRPAAAYGPPPHRPLQRQSGQQPQQVRSGGQPSGPPPWYAQPGYPQPSGPPQYGGHYPQRPQAPYPGAPYGGHPRPGREPQPPAGQVWPPDAAQHGKITGTLFAIALALSAVASVAPGGAIVLAFLWSVVARLVQRSSSGLQRRRQELGGPSPTDMAVTVAALPWRLLMSLVKSLVAMLLPAVALVSVAFVVGSALTGDGVARSSGVVPLFVGMLAGIATAWWGPGGWSLRTGSRAVVRTITHGRAGRVVVASLCLLVVLAAMMVGSRSGYVPDWAPFSSPINPSRY